MFVLECILVLAYRSRQITVEYQLNEFDHSTYAKQSGKNNKKYLKNQEIESLRPQKNNIKSKSLS